MKQIKAAVVVGARPNFIKAAPLLRAIHQSRRIRPILIHTGQHYDKNLSAAFFNDLGITKPSLNLGVGSGSHAVQTGRIMTRLEKVFASMCPEWVVVMGDVNSTLAAALTASKLGIKIAHVEAGMRSGDRTMPEEINRVVTDRLSDLLFTPHQEASRNLLQEGIPKSKIYCVGDIMVDNLNYELRKAAHRQLQHKHPETPYVVLTLHRPSNVDSPKILSGLINAVNRISERIPVYFPVHPRTAGCIGRLGVSWGTKVHIMKPLGYGDFLALTRHAFLILTDSGGLQIESSMLGIPCLTLRNSTERPSTLRRGTNQLTPPHEEDVVKAVWKILDHQGRKRKTKRKLWTGNGRSAERMVRILLRKSISGGPGQ